MLRNKNPFHALWRMSKVFVRVGHQSQLGIYLQVEPEEAKAVKVGLSKASIHLRGFVIRKPDRGRNRGKIERDGEGKEDSQETSNCSAQ